MKLNLVSKSSVLMQLIRRVSKLGGKDKVTNRVGWRRLENRGGDDAGATAVNY